MTPFDNLVIPSYLQMMKLLLPYITSSSQSFLAIFIKFTELQYTIRFFQNSRADLHAQAFEKELSSPFDIAEELIPYLDKEQGDMIQNMFNMMQMAEMFQSFSDMQSGTASSDNSFFSENLMKSMFSPEQQEMFDFYSNMFSQNEESAYDNMNVDADEEETHGKLDESPGYEESGPDEAGTPEDGLPTDLG